MTPQINLKLIDLTIQMGSGNSAPDRVNTPCFMHVTLSQINPTLARKTDGTEYMEIYDLP